VDLVETGITHYYINIQMLAWQAFESNFFAGFVMYGVE
jgi:hypothetical protein